MDYVELKTIVHGMRRLPSQRENGEILVKLDDVIDVLRLAPREEVVHCKECCLCVEEDDGQLVCSGPGGLQLVVEPQDFCGWGEADK